MKPKKIFNFFLKSQTNGYRGDFLCNAQVTKTQIQINMLQINAM